MREPLPPDLMTSLQIIGILNRLPTGQTILAASDGSEISASVTGVGLAIDTLPRTPQCWSVIPKVSSDGTIAAVKLWQFAPVAADSEPHLVWQITGQVVQVSTRKGLISIETQLEAPQPKSLTLTLQTSQSSEFAPHEQWRLTLVYHHLRLYLVRGVRQYPEPARVLMDTVSIDPPPPLVQRLNGVEIPTPVLHRAQALVGSAGTLQAPVRRWDRRWRETVWEFGLTLPDGTGKLKVSADSDRCDRYQLPPHSPRPESESYAQRLIVTPLGAAQSIGASCFQVLIGPYEVVLDAGTRPKGHRPLPDFDRLHHPDLLLISHAHQDHLGAVPVFHSLFPSAPMICTVGTRELAEVMLPDGLKVQQREDFPELFDEADLENCLFHLQTQGFNQEFEPLPGLWVRFIPAGHIVGAACISLRYGQRSLVYTGDYHVANSRTTDGLKLADLPQAEMLITEGTYGASHHPKRSQQERELISAVIQVVQAGGNVLIPAFALGRAQELLLAFRQNAEFGQLGVPIYVDGLVRSVTDCFRDHLALLPESLQRFAQTQEPFFSKSSPTIVAIERSEDRPLAMLRPSVIISSSGMMTGGPSVYYAQTLLERENAALFISGYTDEESPGRKVQGLQTGSEIDLNGKTITVRAQVKRFNLSAHVDRVGVCQVIERVSPQHLILVHGARSTLQELAAASDLKSKYLIYIPQEGEAISIESAPKQLTDHQRKLIELPQSFELTVEAEVEGGWIRVPESVCDDPRWQKLSATGLLKAKWVGEHGLMLTRIQPSRQKLRLDASHPAECCARCDHQENGRCWEDESPMFERQIDPIGHCLEFEPREL